MKKIIKSLLYSLIFLIIVLSSSKIIFARRIGSASSSRSYSYSSPSWPPPPPPPPPRRTYSFTPTKPEPSPADNFHWGDGSSGSSSSSGSSGGSAGQSSVGSGTTNACAGLTCKSWESKLPISGGCLCITNTYSSASEAVADLQKNYKGQAANVQTFAFETDDGIVYCPSGYYVSQTGGSCVAYRANLSSNGSSGSSGSVAVRPPSCTEDDTDCDPTDNCESNGFTTEKTDYLLENVVTCTARINCEDVVRIGDCYEDPGSNSSDDLNLRVKIKEYVSEWIKQTRLRLKKK